MLADRGGAEASMIVLQQTVVPEYRKEIMSLLHESYGAALTVWCGQEYFDPTTQTDIDYPGRIVKVRNHFLLGRRLEWQPGVLGPLLRADVAIIEFNPRILSNWPVLIGRRVRGQRTVLWGHAWSRSGKTARTNRVRRWMRQLSSTMLVYTEQQRTELLASDGGARVIAAPNALYRRHQIRARNSERPTHILYSGRLIPSKKPSLLLEAFLSAIERGLPPDIGLVFAGEGPERDLLERRIAQCQASARVSLLGHVPAAEIHTLYEGALVSASPGYVGLSIVQSISFGVPMIYARDEPHSPEIEAAVDGFNAIPFQSDDIEALARTLLEVADDRAAWARSGPDIAQDCRDRYSVELMADRIIEAAR